MIRPENAINRAVVPREHKPRIVLLQNKWGKNTSSAGTVELLWLRPHQGPSSCPQHWSASCHELCHDLLFLGSVCALQQIFHTRHHLFPFTSPLTENVVALSLRNNNVVQWNNDSVRTWLMILRGHQLLGLWISLAPSVVLCPLSDALQQDNSSLSLPGDL